MNARQSGSPMQQCIWSNFFIFVDSIDSQIILRMISESKTFHLHFSAYESIGDFTTTVVRTKTQKFLPYFTCNMLCKSSPVARDRFVHLQVQPYFGRGPAHRYNGWGWKKLCHLVSDNNETK